MAKVESFDGLISSIQEAFLSVNRMAEQQHLRSMRDLFEEDGTPKTISIRCPAFNEDGSAEYRELDVPVLCLIPVSSLKLNEITIDFKVKLSGKVRLSEPAASNGMAANADAGERIGYIPTFRRRGGNDSYANITLKFLAEEAPEGFLRIRDEMIKILP